MIDLDDIEKLLYIERRFGITKTLKESPTNDRVMAAERELVSILKKYSEQLNLTIPMPKVRTILTDNQIKFTFFDKNNGKRILLGNWLSNKEKYHDR
jgi:hypothetical protein